MSASESESESGSTAVAIIGAGISGVASAAHLIARGIDVTVFERNSQSGGVWVYNSQQAFEPTYPSVLPSQARSDEEQLPFGDIPGPCHPGLRNNVVTRLMKTSLLEWPEGTPDITTHDVMKTYIQDIGDKFGVQPRIRFRTVVQSAVKNGNKWRVRFMDHSRQDSLLSQSDEPATCEKYFDAVVVAVGHYHAPRIPDIPGLAELKQLNPARVYHSKGWRGPQDFKGKKVLVIGTGASALDVIRDLTRDENTVFHSTRGGKFDVPLNVFPPSTIRIGEVSRIDLSEARGDARGDLPARISLKDGRVLCNIDAVILCTGYLVSLPFLTQFHSDETVPAAADDKVIVTDGSMYHNLHKDIFYIPDPSLSFIGVPYYTANFSLFDFQAQVLAAQIAGLAALPSEADMRAGYRRKLAEKGVGKQFHSLRGAEVDYVKELLEWVNPALEAAGHKHLRGHTEQWLATYAELIEKKRLLAAGNPELAVLEQNELQRYVCNEDSAGDGMDHHSSSGSET